MTQVLYVSPLDVTANNGMLQRQHQIVAALGELYPGCLDVMTLHSGPRTVSRWLSKIGVRARVLAGPYVSLARANAMAWYAGNIIARNRLGWGGDFSFPLRTPLPLSMIDKYDLIVCYYAWAFLLLRLDRAGSKVVVDLGDVMGERHRRIGARRWISMSSKAERSILESQARCVAISADDRAEFERIYRISPKIMPFLPPRYEDLLQLAWTPRPLRVGFLGARGHTNEAVLHALSSEPFLDVLASSGVTLVVAGGICDIIDGATKARLEERGVAIRGPVAKLQDFYSQVAAVLNPVGPSTGIKVKSVEALLAGRALVTTCYGADALLRKTFGPQVILLDWPTKPRLLAEAATRAAAANAAVSVAEGTVELHTQHAAEYARHARAAVASLLSP